MHIITQYLLTLVVAICTAASLTDEDIAKILDDTSRGDALSNLDQYDTNLQIASLRDKLRTLEGLESDTGDLYPAQESGLLGDAINGRPHTYTGSFKGDTLAKTTNQGDFSNIYAHLGGKSTIMQGKESRGLFRAPSRVISSILSKNTNKGLHFTEQNPNSVLNEETLIPDSIDLMAERDQKALPLDQSLPKRNLFCNRRTGCGGKRGKRGRAKTNSSDNYCSRVKCEAKRVLCNRDGCMSKRMDSLIGEIVCGNFRCTSHDVTTNRQTSNRVLGNDLGAAGRDIANQLHTNRRENSERADISTPAINDTEGIYKTKSNFKRFLSRQIDRENILKVREMICKTYDICLNERNDFLQY